MTSSSGGISCGATCSASYTAATSVTLTATASSGYSFTGWSGACSGSSTSCTVSMTVARSVGASFAPLLTVTRSGLGTVTSNPSGINCSSTSTACSQAVSGGGSVVLTAAAGSGYSFNGWGGACSGSALSCTVSMSVARTVSASFTAISASADLCAGLVTDKANHAMTALARPAVGAAATDPQFGTTIRRLSNAGSGNVIKTAYSTIPAWNSDESYIILYHTGSSVTGGAGHHLYNGRTYAYIKKLNIDPPDLEQFYWDNDDPDLLYYVDGSNRLIRLHVAAGTKDTLHTFSCSGNQVTGGGDPMFTSWDSDLFGFACGNKFFSYRLSTNTESSRITDGSGSGLAPIASPSGTYMYAGLSGGAKVYDTSMNLLRTLVLDGDTHASLGKLADGTDVFVGVEFDGSYEGTLVAADLATGTPRVIIGPATGYPYPPSGTHVNATAFKKPGWTAVSVVGNTNGATVLNQELLLVNTNPGGSVCRVAHHRSYGKEGSVGYWAEPHPVLSPSGTRMLFTSDWGNSGATDTYVVELPSYVP